MAQGRGRRAHGSSPPATLTVLFVPLRFYYFLEKNLLHSELTLQVAIESLPPSVDPLSGAAATQLCIQPDLQPSRPQTSLVNRLYLHVCVRLGLLEMPVSQIISPL